MIESLISRVMNNLSFKSYGIGFLLASCITLITAFSLFNFSAVNNMKDGAQWVRHTYEVMAKGHQIEKLIVDLETGQRGFLITGEDTFLKPFNDARLDLSVLISETRAQVSDNPDQVRLMDDIESAIKTWYDVSGNSEIDLRRTVNSQSVDDKQLQTLIDKGVGKGIHDQIRQELDALDEIFVKSENDVARRFVSAISKAIVDQETGQRGFLITGKEEFLEPYHQGSIALGEHIEQLHLLLDNDFDSEVIMRDLLNVEALVLEWQHLLENAEGQTSASKAGNEEAELLDEMTPLLSRVAAAFSKTQNHHAASRVLAIRTDLAMGQAASVRFRDTHNHQLLKDMDGYVAEAILTLSRLKQTVTGKVDTSVAYRHLGHIERLALRWETAAAIPEIEIRRKMTQNKASISDVIEQVSLQTGKKLMDEIRSLLIRFIKVEQNLLEQREAKDNKAFGRTMAVQMLGSVLYGGLVVLMFVLAGRLRRNTDSLELEKGKMEEQTWVRSNASKITASLQSCKTIEEASDTLITTLAPLIDGQLGLVYRAFGADQSDLIFKLTETYAYHAREKNDSVIKFGEGLVGQAALERKTILLTRYEDDLPVISTGSADIKPGNILVFPVLYKDQLLMMVEIASTSAMKDKYLELVEVLSGGLGLIFNNILTNLETNRLLMESQTQAEELENQKDNLSSANDLLEQQKMQLQSSEEELKIANDDLIEKQYALSRQKAEVDEARKEAEVKAGELSKASTYKSEFLANMSHELRTPLNSLLILSKMLADNKGGNLSEVQVNYSNTIHDSGNDLLTLINDILDLSKIESGKMEIHVEQIQLDGFVENLRRRFDPVVQGKGIDLNVDLQNAPASWVSDGQKIDQILKNLLSNAIKFTAEGSVTLTIEPPEPDALANVPGLEAEDAIAFVVKDTGIGIAKEKRAVIFEAFKQGDGTTNRKFGGTGLGLSISRELSNLLSGAIHIESEVGKGSTFTLVIPRDLSGKWQQQSDDHGKDAVDEWAGEVLYTQSAGPEQDGKGGEVETAGAAMFYEPHSFPPLDEAVIESNGLDIQPGDRILLLIEDDERFANIVSEVAKSRDFKILIAPDGQTGMQYADYYQPSGIVLDIGLPDVDGRQVLEALKDNPRTRHIPVHYMSAHDSPHDIRRDGAVGFLTKPVSLQQLKTAFERIEEVIDGAVKRLLLVEDDQVLSQSISDLIGDDDVETVIARSGKEALSHLGDSHFDCVILDLGLPDVDGVELLETIRTTSELSQVPVIIHTGRDLTADERVVLDRYAQSIIPKDAHSSERLLDDTSLFLHRVESHLPDGQQKIIRMLHNTEVTLEDKTVLVVDDDMRNVFSLSAILQDRGMIVLTASNGVEALDMLDTNKSIEIVLMDIMMPEMDGYEAMEKIRSQDCFKDLPIIALTAKAMSDDRAKCIQKGANDYMAKPVNIDKLLSIMRVWLHQDELMVHEA